MNFRLPMKSPLHGWTNFLFVRKFTTQMQILVGMHMVVMEDYYHMIIMDEDVNEMKL